MGYMPPCSLPSHTCLANLVVCGPALYAKERKAFWPFILLSYPLFVGGGLFGILL
ncbi:MAG: hypothetical protein Ct9H300mP28_35700 [Pseudomonadota bacterium]|nr:MAG: hypothetical protein Ct9H300mP28_35700 [Pseudomonadota bacterium]